METQPLKQPNLGPHDLHCVVSGSANVCKIYNAGGQLLREIPAFPHGIAGPRTDVPDGDTPPGLYLVTGDIETQASEPAKTWNSYGQWFMPLQEEESQESSVGRAGVGWHGGGTGLPDPQAPFQELIATEGCIRSHNKDVAALVSNFRAVRKSGGKVWLTVIQP